MNIKKIIEKFKNVEWTPIICFIGFAFILGMLQYLAVVPMDRAEWFYGTKEERLYMNTNVYKHIEIRYKNGVPIDTTEMVIKDIKVK